MVKGRMASQTDAFSRDRGFVAFLVDDVNMLVCAH